MKLSVIIKDTFRECLSKKIILSFFAVSTITILALLLIFRIKIVGDEVFLYNFLGEGEGSADLYDFYDVIVKFQAVFAMTLYSIGLFISIFSTADLTPSMMRKGRLDLYLARPVSRATLLSGKYIGAVSVVSLNILYAIIGMWLVIGIKTGVWNLYFLYSGLTIIFMFSVLYVFVLFIGIFINSTAVNLIIMSAITILNMVLAQREEFFLLIYNKPLEITADVIYWILPKYYELSIITKDLVEGLEIASWTPVVSSLVSAGVLFYACIFFFSRKNC